MLIPLELNPNSSVPSHVKDWSRVKLLKKIDDFRWTIDRQYNFTPTPEFLMMLKFCLICEMARPTYDSEGNVLTISEDCLQFDVSKEDIMTELTNVGKILRNNAFSLQTSAPFDCTILNAKERTQSNGAVTYVEPFGFYSVFGNRPRKPGPYETNDMEHIVWEPIPYLPSEYSIRTCTFYNSTMSSDSPLALLNRLVRAEGQAVSYTYDTAVVNENHPQWPKLFSLISLIYQATSIFRVPAYNMATLPSPMLNLSGSISNVRLSFIIMYFKHAWEYVPPAQAGFPKKFKSDMTPYGSVGINMYNFPDPNTGNTVKSKSALDPSYNNQYKVCKFIDEKGVVTYLPVKDWDAGVNPTPTIYGTNTVIKLTDFMAFSPIIAKQIFDGTFKSFNGVLYSDASKFYELEFIRLSPEILAMMDKLEAMQLGIQQLRDELFVQKRFKDVYTVVSYGGRSFDAICSYYTDDNGIVTQFMHPIKGVWHRGVAYFYEMIADAMALYKKIDTALKTMLNDRQERNNLAYDAAYQNFLRGEATLKGPEALAAFEEKTRTGVFYMKDGYEYWRAYTQEEQLVINELNRQLIANEQQIQTNLSIEEQNRAAQEAADNAVIAQNAEYQRLADQAVIDSMKAEQEALDSQITAENNALINHINGIVPPGIELVSKIADDNGLILSQALVKWMNDNPYYVHNPTVKAVVDNLAAEIQQAEEMVSTRMITNAIIDEEFTKALEELFTIKS